MARITSSARNSLPSNKFALPGQRKYPVDSPGRAANAKARATQGVEAGTLSPSQAAKIRSKANKVLAKG